MKNAIKNAYKTILLILVQPLWVLQDWLDSGRQGRIGRCKPFAALQRRLWCILGLAPLYGGLPDDLWAHHGESGRPGRTMRAVRLDAAPPKIDGRLDDAAWAHVPVYTGLTQRDPDEGQAATEDTQVRLAYDDEALYIGVAALDAAPQDITARLVRRDQWTEADHIQVLIDPYHDHQTAYWFMVNAAGSVEDGFISDDGDDWDNTWDGVWQVETGRDAKGWYAEYRIPYHVLRFNAQTDYVWGINVGRYISRKKERVYWAMVPRADNGWVSRFGHLEGISAIEPARALEFLPYAVGRSTFVPHSQPNHRDVFGNLGASLRYGLSSGVSLNATVNPDFGQVEADPAELNLSVFETFQRERRPFFVEGSQVFDTPIDLFYSRRIGRRPGHRDIPEGYEEVERADFTTILGAVKVTGKTRSRTTFGFLDAVTANEYAVLDSPYPGSGAVGLQRRDFLVEPWSSFFVGRIKQDLFKGNSHVGLMATALNRSRGPNAYSGGVDWNIKWRDSAYDFWGQVAGSRAGEDGTGLGNIAVLGKRSGWLRAELWWEAYSEDFQVNDMGFQWRSDYYQPWLWLQARRDKPWGLFRRNFFNLNRWGMWNLDGDNLEDGFNVNTQNQFANYWWLGGEYTHKFASFDDLDTRGGPLIAVPSSDEVEFFVESDDRRVLSGWFEVEWGSDAAGGWWRELAAGITLRPTANLEVRLRPRYEWRLRDAQWIENIDADNDGEDDRYIYGRLRSKTLDFTTRANLIFSRDLSLELYVQPFVTAGDYSGFKALSRPAAYAFTPHPGPAGDPDFKRRSVQSNLVLRWEYRPGSTLFLVWAQARDLEVERPRLRPLRDIGAGFTDDGTHILLLKFNYWLHL